MKITTRYYDPVAILDLEGALTLGRGDVLLRGRLLELLEEGYRRILLNMGAVRHVDSSGLGELLRSRETCEERGAELKLLHLNPGAYRLLTMSKLVGLFEIFDSEAEAIPSFWHEGEPPTS